MAASPVRRGRFCAIIEGETGVLQENSPLQPPVYTLQSRFGGLQRGKWAILQASAGERPRLNMRKTESAFMILADKIIDLRKKNGWSQEELAEKLNVSRQAVSKWEGAQSVPDLARILQMAELFGVTTDYLLRDEMEAEEMTAGSTAAEAPVRRVTMEEANEFIACQERESGKIALGVLLCILSPVCLISLGAEAAKGVLSETAAGAAGIVILLGMIAAAVALFITSGMRSEKWQFLEEEEFESEYGVEGMARERQKAMRPGFVRNITVGVVLCILSPVPLILSGLLETEGVSAHMVSFLLAMVGAAVVLFIRAGMPHEALEKLLQEGDYTAEKKRSAPLKERVAAVYWTVAAAVYLAWSFMTDGWGETWIVWPVAGVLFAAVAAIIETGGRSRTRD